MKVIIQIPCYNEEATLPETLAALPREIPGVDEVQVLVIDDGSTDRTAEVARQHGADVIVRHIRNQGLASAFSSGMAACLEQGADFIVNTDADNQYDARDIPRLLEPLLRGEADIVIGDRQTHTVAQFSWLKKRLQWLGSFVVRRVAGLDDVPDAVSGFRAFSRQAAKRINILSAFSYTIEMVVQAGKKGMAVRSVPIGVNPMTRRSRLYSSVPEFIQRSVTTLLRVYAMFRPLKIFMAVGLLLMLVGSLPVLRFLYFFVRDAGAGHVQSLVLGGVLMSMGFMSMLIALVADLIAFNRQLLEMVLDRLHRLEDGRRPDRDSEDGDSRDDDLRDGF